MDSVYASSNLSGSTLDPGVFCRARRCVLAYLRLVVGGLFAADSFYPRFFPGSGAQRAGGSECDCSRC